MADLIGFYIILEAIDTLAMAIYSKFLVIQLKFPI